MWPDEMNHRALKGHRKPVAQRTGDSESLVAKFCNPPHDRDGEGRTSPAERVIVTHHALVADGAIEQARAFLADIATECGYTLVPLDCDSTPADLNLSGELLKELGEFLRAEGDARAAGTITEAHSERIVAEGREAIAVLCRIVAANQRNVVESETATERTRKGPRRVDLLTVLREKRWRISA